MQCQYTRFPTRLVIRKKRHYNTKQNEAPKTKNQKNSGVEKTGFDRFLARSGVRVHSTQMARRRAKVGGQTANDFGEKDDGRG